MHITLYKLGNNEESIAKRKRYDLNNYCCLTATKAFRLVKSYGNNPSDLVRCLTSDGFLEYMQRLCNNGYLDVQLNLLAPEEYTKEDYDGQPKPCLVPMVNNKKNKGLPLFYVAQILNAMSPTYLESIKEEIDNVDYVLQDVDSGRGKRFTRVFSNLSSGMKVAHRLFNSVPPTELENCHLMIANLLSSCYNEYLEAVTHETIPKTNTWTTGQKVVGRTKQACYKRHSDLDVTLNSAIGKPFFVDHGINETRLPYKEEQQTITFCYHNGNKEIIEVAWWDDKTDLGAINTPNNSIHWQLAGSQLYEHEVRLKKGAVTNGKEWRMIISFRMLLDPKQFPHEYRSRVLQGLKCADLPEPFHYLPHKPISNYVTNYTKSNAGIKIASQSASTVVGESSVNPSATTSNVKRSPSGDLNRDKKRRKKCTGNVVGNTPYDNLGNIHNTDRWKQITYNQYQCLGLLRPGTITEVDTPMEHLVFHPTVVRKYIIERNVLPQRRTLCLDNEYANVDVLYCFGNPDSMEKFLIYPGMLINKEAVVNDGNLNHSHRSHKIWDSNPGSENVLFLTKGYKNETEDIKRMIMNEDVNYITIHGPGGSGIFQGCHASSLARDSRDDTNYVISTHQKLGKEMKKFSDRQSVGQDESDANNLNYSNNDFTSNTADNNNDVFIRYTKNDKIVGIVVDPTEFRITSVWGDPGDGKTIVGDKDQAVCVGYCFFKGYTFDSLSNEEINEMDLLLDTNCTDQQWQTFLKGKHYSYKLQRLFSPQDYEIIKDMNVWEFDKLVFEDKHMKDKFRVEISPECKQNWKGVKEGEGWGCPEMYNAFVDEAQYVPYLLEGYRHTHDPITIRIEAKELSDTDKMQKMMKWIGRMPTAPVKLVGDFVDKSKLTQFVADSKRFLTDTKLWYTQMPAQELHKSTTKDHISVLPMNNTHSTSKTQKGTRSTPGEMMLSLSFAQAACYMRILRQNIMEDGKQGTVWPLQDESLGFILRTHPFASPNRTMDPIVMYQRIAALHDLKHKPEFGKLICYNGLLHHADFAKTVFRAVFSRVAGRVPIFYLCHLWANHMEKGPFGLLPTKDTVSIYFHYLELLGVTGNLSSIQKVQHINFIPTSMTTFEGLKNFYKDFCLKFDILVDLLIPSTADFFIYNATETLAQTMAECSNSNFEDCYWLSQTILADVAEIYDLVHMYNHEDVSAHHVKTGFGGEQGCELIDEKYKQEVGKKKQKKLEVCFESILQDVGKEKRKDPRWLACNALYLDEQDRPEKETDLWLPRHIVNKRKYNCMDVKNGLCKCGQLGSHTLGSRVLSVHPMASQPWLHPIRFRNQKDVLNDLCPEYKEYVIDPGLKAYQEMVKDWGIELPDYCHTRVEAQEVDGKLPNINIPSGEQKNVKTEQV